jgi:hypothetical protein
LYVLSLSPFIFNYIIGGNTSNHISNMLDLFNKASIMHLSAPGKLIKPSLYYNGLRFF